MLKTSTIAPSHRYLESAAGRPWTPAVGSRFLRGRPLRGSASHKSAAGPTSPRSARHSHVNFISRGASRDQPPPPVSKKKTSDEDDKWKQTLRLHSTGNARCRNVRLDVGTQQNGTAREKKDELSCGEMLCRRVGNEGHKVQRGAGKRDCLRRRRVRGVQAAAARSRAPRRGLAGRGGARPCAAATVAAS
ncbi:uncharacterized protein LOC124799060 [Schistocerca piceifrons]|uniref:uncharacterized protein LOC124799060 n=1 Tax=Schistocerca piceifrons TaxID=274613 RepID=UPI001F5F1C44|nr:uncharacterized protein LOC124799060 [Schistocerca piceifrons]